MEKPPGQSCSCKQTHACLACSLIKLSCPTNIVTWFLKLSLCLCWWMIQQCASRIFSFFCSYTIKPVISRSVLRVFLLRLPSVFIEVRWAVKWMDFYLGKLVEFLDGVIFISNKSPNSITKPMCMWWADLPFWNSPLGKMIVVSSSIHARVIISPTCQLSWKLNRWPSFSIKQADTSPLLLWSLTITLDLTFVFSTIPFMP